MATTQHMLDESSLFKFIFLAFDCFFSTSRKWNRKNKKKDNTIFTDFETQWDIYFIKDFWYTLMV